MRTSVGQPVRLVDYRPPDFLINSVDLDISLDRNATRVKSTLTIRRNPAGRADADLSLDGDELVFISAELDGQPLEPGRFQANPSQFLLPGPPKRPFKLRIETRLDPAANTKLMGLYRSGSAYCTQCEAEGFRRIAYFLDRPDVLSTYRVRLEADRAEAPVLLSNGNLESAGESGIASRHWAVWSDPHRKPCYLFALVAGDLAHISDSFVTTSGRNVALAIYVEPGREERATYAMDALKRSMAWDERVYGREYDLDVFNIVAVSDFNMGAMENKGLNIFNDKYVLASQQTATDDDYASIEGVIAHEYFHNWTGNRVTCRDWFQLCLKEGLTVFRDQEFSADMRSAPVKRIAEVRALRSAQFPEDAGPLAHNVRPEVYNEISNFYTATVYQKGAEVVRMLETPDRFRRLPGRHGHVLPSLRRTGGHRRGLHWLLRRHFGTRLQPVHALVHAGWDAEVDGPHRLRRGSEDLPRRNSPSAGSNARTGDEIADDDADCARLGRPAGRRVRPCLCRRHSRGDCRRHL